MSTTLYLCGPMSGIENLNFPLFNSEAARLRSLGYVVVNPAELNGGAAELVATEHMTKEQLKAHWRDCMRRDIPELLKCDGVALLPGYESSKGATLEICLAGQFDMPVMLASDLVSHVLNFDDMEAA